jgi:hypothetical protein
VTYDGRTTKLLDTVESYACRFGVSRLRRRCVKQARVEYPRERSPTGRAAETPMKRGSSVCHVLSRAHRNADGHPCDPSAGQAADSVSERGGSGRGVGVAGGHRGSLPTSIGFQGTSRPRPPSRFSGLGRLTALDGWPRLEEWSWGGSEPPSESFAWRGATSLTLAPGVRRGRGTDASSRKPSLRALVG